jgi:hypothetical protein
MARHSARLISNRPIILSAGYRLSHGVGSVLRVSSSRHSESTLSFFYRHAVTVLAAIVLGALVTVSVTIAREVLTICLMKPIQVESAEALIEAMKQKKSSLLRHLAFLDFVDLSATARLRREEFFKLSQPGGHPRNWDGLSGAALQVIDDFVTDLNKTSQNEPAAAASVASQQPPNQYYDLRQRHLAAASATAANNNGAVKKPSATKSEKETKGALDQLVDKILKNPLFAPFPDSKARMVFAQSQLVIWAVEGNN